MNHNQLVTEFTEHVIKQLDESLSHVAHFRGLYSASNWLFRGINKCYETRSIQDMIDAIENYCVCCAQYNCDPDVVMLVRKEAMKLFDAFIEFINEQEDK